MALPETDFSEDSDEIDSELEFELYSQLHYSNESKKLITSASNDLPAPGQLIGKATFLNKTKNEVTESSGTTFPPSIDYSSESNSEFEEWEIMNSQCNTGDQILKTNKNLDIHVTRKSTKSAVDCNIIEDTPDARWDVIAKDVCPAANPLRYFGKSSKRCKNCNEVGHTFYKCPNPRKLKPCFLCGRQGHSSWGCRRFKDLDRFDAKVECNRCRKMGHRKDNCPDVWRQFHLTVKSGPLVMPEQHSKTSENVFCFYCFSDCHVWYNCTNRHYRSLLKTLPSPTVFKYDGLIDVRDADCAAKQGTSLLTEISSDAKVSNSATLSSKKINKKRKLPPVGENPKRRKKEKIVKSTTCYPPNKKEKTNQIKKFNNLKQEATVFSSKETVQHFNGKKVTSGNAKKNGLNGLRRIKSKKTKTKTEVDRRGNRTSTSGTNRKNTNQQKFSIKREIGNFETRTFWKPHTSEMDNGTAKSKRKLPKLSTFIENNGFIKKFIRKNRGKKGMFQ